MSLKVRVEYIFMSLKMLTAVLKTAILSVWRDKSAHNAICDFYAHMARNRERRFARCFRRKHRTAIFSCIVNKEAANAASKYRI